MGFDRDARCEVIAASSDSTFSGPGFALTVERVRPPLDEFDALVIPGGFGTRRLVDDRDVLAWLAGFPANRLLATVCTGALVAGAMGRLRGRRATTHASALADLGAHGATASTDRVVDEGQLVTAGGVTAALDLGLHLVARLAGDDAMRAIARQMEWTPRSPRSD
jgi:cyclohexyl-isocyanide hydratase